MTIAIPTHLRSDTIASQSISFALTQLRARPDDVHVFVSDASQLPSYKKALAGTGVNIINAETKNVRDKFNFIHSFFKDSREVLVVEDDVKGLVGITPEQPASIIATGFKQMRDKQKSLWGIYPSSNKFYMRKIVRTGFNYIVANLYGFIADGDARVLIKEHSKTDYERSVLYNIHKNGSVRLDYVAANTNNYTNKGGMQTLPNRALLESTACLNLIRRFPQYIGIKNGSKSRYMEIKFLK